MLTTDLLQEARKHLNKIGENCTQGPLTAKDVYPKAWVEKKVNNDLPETIQSLTADGHNLKLQLKASAKGTSALEGQRSFNPTVIEGFTSKPDGQVPKFMQLMVLQEWNYGEELPIYDLPRNASCVYKTFQMSSSLQLLIFPRPTCMYMLRCCLHMKNRVLMRGGSVIFKCFRFVEELISSTPAARNISLHECVFTHRHI